RLFVEDEGEVGCGLFHKRRERTFHVLGNVLRLIISIILAPVYIFAPQVLIQSASNYLQAGWLVEYATTPDAVL
ncbi:hypothetical protein C8F01DRAFT_950803, partial [Mycena amicta]